MLVVLIFKGSNWLPHINGQCNKTVFYTPHDISLSIITHPKVCYLAMHCENHIGTYVTYVAIYMHFVVIVCKYLFTALIRTVIRVPRIGCNYIHKLMAGLTTYTG